MDQGDSFIYITLSYTNCTSILVGGLGVEWCFSLCLVFLVLRKKWWMWLQNVQSRFQGVLGRLPLRHATLPSVSRGQILECTWLHHPKVPSPERPEAQASLCFYTLFLGKSWMVGEAILSFFGPKFLSFQVRSCRFPVVGVSWIYWSKVFPGHQKKRLKRWKHGKPMVCQKWEFSCEYMMNLKKKHWILGYGPIFCQNFCHGPFNQLCWTSLGDVVIFTGQRWLVAGRHEILP